MAKGNFNFKDTDKLLHVYYGWFIIYLHQFIYGVATEGIIATSTLIAILRYNFEYDLLKKIVLKFYLKIKFKAKTKDLNFSKTMLIKVGKNNRKKLKL